MNLHFSLRTKHSLQPLDSDGKTTPFGCETRSGLHLALSGSIRGLECILKKIKIPILVNDLNFVFCFFKKTKPSQEVLFPIK